MKNAMGCAGSGPKVHVILNPASSAGRTGRRRGEIRAALERHLGRGFSFLATTRPNEATDSARLASLRGTDLVVAVGGDGTVQEVVNGLMDAGTPPDRRPQLGIVNTGTGHGFAQSLGLPSGIEAQCAAVASGACRRIDIGRAVYARGGRRVERYFVNECQAGIGGRVVEKVQAGHKRLGGFLAFGLATLTTALSYPNRAFKFSVDDGRERSGAFIGIVAANGPFMAGGMRLAPCAAVEDGWLDIILIYGQTVAERLRNFPKIYTGKHLGSPKFGSLRARSLSLAAEGPVAFEADGELWGHLPCRIEVLPAALEVRTAGREKG